MNLLKRLEAALLAGQHGHPKGIIGRLLGERMVRQHVSETLWTISLLHLQPDDRVLELGFGAGKAIELVAAQTPHGHVSGIDISQEMVRSANRRNTHAIEAGRVTLHHGDLTNLPFQDNSFDKIFTIQTLYFWPDPPRALAEIFRVLKPAATLIVTLSTGTVDTTETTGLEHYELLLQEQILPCMHRLGFIQARIQQGPPSRQFKTTAIIGVK